VAPKHSRVAAGSGVQQLSAAYIAAMQDTLTRAPWSATDDEDLRTAIAGGATVEDAATFLARTADDVAIRAATLGLRWHEFLH